MEEIYLVTGAAGHLGNVLTRELVRQGRRVWVFLLPGEKNRVEGVERIFYGDVRDTASLEGMFAQTLGAKLIVIHCAGIVSIKTAYSQLLVDVNVRGTLNVVDLCASYAVDRLIYISSVHAIPEGATGELIGETDQFNPDRVTGHYAKSKAAATAYVLAAGKRGLKVNVIHPSGFIGPFDYGHSHLTTMIEDYCSGRLFAGMTGGYDFADVRDIAQGIIACADQGRPGECYILSNRYYTVWELLEMLHEITGKRAIRSYLPLWFARLTAPLAEFYYKVLKQAPLYTQYSIYTLSTDSHYSHDKATRELGYQTRDMRETLKDTCQWLIREKRVSGVTVPRE